jgi:hypothetical protein
MVEEKGHLFSRKIFSKPPPNVLASVFTQNGIVKAEQMLQRIIKRAKYIKRCFTNSVLNKFINAPIHTVTLRSFCGLDDYDVLTVNQRMEQPFRFCFVNLM